MHKVRRQRDDDNNNNNSNKKVRLSSAALCYSLRVFFFYSLSLSLFFLVPLLLSHSIPFPLPPRCVAAIQQRRWRATLLPFVYRWMGRYRAAPGALKGCHRRKSRSRSRRRRLKRQINPDRLFSVLERIHTHTHTLDGSFFTRQRGEKRRENDKDSYGVCVCDA